MLSENSHDLESDPRLVSQPDADGVRLHVGRSDIFTIREEHAELVPDLLRHGHRLDSNLIPDDSIGTLAGDVLDKDDLDFPAKQGSDDARHVPLSLLLPDTRLALWDARQATDDEMVLEADVLLELGQLSVLSGLILEGSVEPLVVLLQRHHAVLKNSRCLTVLSQNLFRTALKGVDQT